MIDIVHSQTYTSKFIHVSKYAYMWIEVNKQRDVY